MQHYQANRGTFQEKAAPHIVEIFEPNLDLEHKDDFKASTFTFKFVSFKASQGQYNQQTQMQMPSKMFFTLKFFSFKETKTETVVLKAPQDQQSYQSAMNQEHVPGQLHYLQKIKQL